MTSFPGELPLQLSVLTVSNRHTVDTDDTGIWLVNALQQQGHQLNQRCIAEENIYQIRAAVSALIADVQTQVILLCGGTGFHAKNCTVEAIAPLFDREIPGFGELFRTLSYQKIGSAALQSGAIAGIANQKLIFAMPGSVDAAQLAADQIIWPQLIAHTKPCNFTSLLRRGSACSASAVTGTKYD
ncbi:molybdenum cofactor synthesis domain-containing protein [Rheinheimera texasensis]|uniref:molybdenum cofactor synthesis domain-containing protein n=1 Tax=Rheinheimera texasensis TaxID=306205 RepID=UPI00068DC694|nr:molybdenum cofactor synthesis domain-containing protein [Rheinheimera texasensis]